MNVIVSCRIIFGVKSRHDFGVDYAADAFTIKRFKHVGAVFVLLVRLSNHFNFNTLSLFEVENQFFQSSVRRNEQRRIIGQHDIAAQQVHYSYRKVDFCLRRKQSAAHRQILFKSFFDVGGFFVGLFLLDMSFDRRLIITALAEIGLNLRLKSFALP